MIRLSEASDLTNHGAAAIRGYLFPINLCCWRPYVHVARGEIYIGIKQCDAFQHSSFLKDARVAAAGVN
ncbi:uncharacterized protein MYCFIDRAFT_183775 [Pseudocercospora fijiensis CIRAD86]|uniref:Uncharacterized protein n=1 Tax=Pseudocercospora fijiensis (strain CIRAD86) TaxID=383855 RepID=M3ARE9_PSEFD|nr:uncharacterized protein MYCFIDRAFT_183775 [Pseudocercospora fijiensis CIRAD86]EME79648.1 hypothetical protein MYCFIDRAFT_208858 [Pseudocercospora fijiensis CIRAD86]